MDGHVEEEAQQPIWEGKQEGKKNSQTLTRATNWIYLRPVSRDPELI